MEKAVAEWLEISEYDLKTAEAMLETGRYLYVAFMCQQAIEKLLKAIYTQKKAEVPPRTHNLLLLRKAMMLTISEEDMEFLSELNKFYIETRYPEDRDKLAKTIHRKDASDILEKAKEVWKCLRKMLK